MKTILGAIWLQTTKWSNKKRAEMFQPKSK